MNLSQSDFCLSQLFQWSPHYQIHRLYFNPLHSSDSCLQYDIHPFSWSIFLVSRILLLILSAFSLISLGQLLNIRKPRPSPWTFSLGLYSLPKWFHEAKCLRFGVPKNMFIFLSHLDNHLLYMHFPQARQKHGLCSQAVRVWVSISAYQLCDLRQLI